jgi:hypothetical protein
MNLFRSEEHIRRWLGSRDPGATIAVTKLSELAHAWWGNRIDPHWRPRTREQNQAILNGLGLTDGFWNLSAVSAPP